MRRAGLKTYPNYMMGGGYVVSGDVASSLVNINRKMKLKFTPIEDATLGFWLMSMDLRHIDHPRFYSWAAPCCFKAPVRREGQRIVTRFQLQEVRLLPPSLPPLLHLGLQPPALSQAS